MRTQIKKIRSWAFKLRGGIWTVLFFFILSMANPSSDRIAIGLVPVAIGQLIRFWAVGCIVLYRGEKVKADRLVTWGPYSLFRNPLYTGNALIGLGWGIMAGFLGTFLFIGSFFLLYVLLIIPYEEAFLLERFGTEYENYRKNVGPFFPKKWPPEIKRGPFDLSVIWKSELHSLAVTVLGTVVLVSRLWW